MMTVQVDLSAAVFRRFTVFDILRRRKQWRGPVLFALILGVSAALCFTRSQIRGAVLLGNVLLFVGLGLPCLYFAYFFSSLSRQISQRGLARPQRVYTVTLSEKSDGIRADNEREKLTYAWKNVHHIYRDLTAAYLYLTPERALILPYSCIEDTDAFWELVRRRLPPEKISVL